MADEVVSTKLLTTRQAEPAIFSNARRPPPERERSGGRLSYAASFSNTVWRWSRSRYNPSRRISCSGAPSCDDAGRLQHDDAVECSHRRQAMRDRDHGPVAHQRSRAPARIASSDSLSSAEVASSSSSSGASFRNARAIAMRWRWPPDSFTPRSPTIVAMPLRQMPR